MAVALPFAFVGGDLGEVSTAQHVWCWGVELAASMIGGCGLLAGCGQAPLAFLALPGQAKGASAGSDGVDTDLPAGIAQFQPHLGEP